MVSGRSALPLDETQQHPPPPRAHKEYVDVLCREIRAVARRWLSDSTLTPPSLLSTLYIGGGTPSLLHPSLLERVIRTVRDAIGLDSGCEITVEMDPATFTPHTAESYRELGVNRASVGAQSFDDDLLAICRRVHRAADISLATTALRKAGFENISLDLISGLPGQTLTSWKTTLVSALDLHSEHISSYDLTLEPGTPFGNKYESGTGPLPPEDVVVDMMTATAGTLRSAGFEHYEVSSFARRNQSPDGSKKSSPFRSRHNMAYWRNEPFYAFGLGSTSLLDGYRFARPRRMADYRAYVEGLDNYLNDPGRMDQMNWREQTLKYLYPGLRPLTTTERLEDYLINSSRLLVEGVSLGELEDLFGSVERDRLVKAVEKNNHLEREGNLIVTRHEQQRMQAIRLTERGMLIENSVLSTLLQDAIWRHENRCGS